MTIAIIDDSSKDISLLYEYICRYCNERREGHVGADKSWRRMYLGIVVVVIYVHNV